MNDESVTLDDSVETPHPGGITINKLRWILRNPFWPLLLGIPLVLACAAAFMWHWAIWLIVVPLFGLNLLYWRRITEHFRFGDANPGKVVSTDPILIAVRSDLTIGYGSYPVVKIVEEAASDRWPTPLEVGHRVATVALYARPEDQTLMRWGDFNPKPVEPIAVRPEDAHQLRESFSDEEWDLLDRGIAELSDLTVGLHRIEVDTSTWAAEHKLRPQ